ncbi:MAG TPA: energy transducer TonB [Rhodanobacter sp.]|nr:energy transducer TonB [Rhodanobacter sp.]
MPRLRTTTGLSLLLLAGGIAGTGWLSTLTAGWSGPVAKTPTRHSATIAKASVQRHAHAPVHVAKVVRTAPQEVTPAAAPTPPAPLEPVAMPYDTTQPWYRLRGHLDGRVVVHVDTDGRGQVDRASLVESSGDPVLDEHALRSVRGWRFAVPADHPAGVSGELPMRFSSHQDSLARAP